MSQDGFRVLKDVTHEQTGESKDLLRNMPSCQQAVFWLLILKGIPSFPPNFHLKWSFKRNLSKMTIWYIKASLILLMDYIISIKILLNMVWHIFNYFTHYSPSECQKFLTTALWWKRRGISGVLHHSHLGFQVEAANKQSLSHVACRISTSFSKHQYLTWKTWLLIQKKVGICC